jgi:hypothetical protein
VFNRSRDTNRTVPKAAAKFTGLSARDQNHTDANGLAVVRSLLCHFNQCYRGRTEAPHPRPRWSGFSGVSPTMISKAAASSPIFESLIAAKSAVTADC